MGTDIGDNVEKVGTFVSEQFLGIIVDGRDLELPPQRLGFSTGPIVQGHTAGPG
jgi:hypothetical protein